MDQYWNTFSYCGNNPLNFIDPYGLYADDIDMEEKRNKVLEELDNREFTEAVDLDYEQYHIRASDPNDLEARLEEVVHNQETMIEMATEQKDQSYHAREEMIDRMNERIELNEIRFELALDQVKDVGQDFGSNIANSIITARNSVSFDYSGNTGDFDNPVMYDRNYINIARAMQMDQVANGFRNYMIGAYSVAGAYYLGPPIVAGAKAGVAVAWPKVVGVGTVIYKHSERMASWGLSFYQQNQRQVNFLSDIVSGRLTPSYSLPQTEGAMTYAVSAALINEVKNWKIIQN